jgi:hypothetical protein
MIVFETILQDLRYGARTWLRTPEFTPVSILALALGIGVNTAAFTAYEAFVARPLDAREPGATNSRFSFPDYQAYRRHLFPGRAYCF